MLREEHKSYRARRKKKKQPLGKIDARGKKIQISNSATRHLLALSAKFSKRGVQSHSFCKCFFSKPVIGLSACLFITFFTALHSGFLNDSERQEV